MIKKIYSKAEPNRLLHMVFYHYDFRGGRKDIVAEDQFLQCAVMRHECGKTFRPHQHFARKVTHENYIPQESWVVIKGKVAAIYYDTDGEFLEKAILDAGDASFTLAGGHNYEFLAHSSLVYEFKTGPYLGQENDKVFLND